MTELAPNEQAALDELTFALGGPHTLEAIARRLGVSRGYVQEIERRALGKLRHAAKRKGLSYAALVTPERERIGLAVE